MGLLHKQGFYLCLTLIMSLIIPKHPYNPWATQQLHQMELIPICISICHYHIINIHFLDPIHSFVARVDFHMSMPE